MYYWFVHIWGGWLTCVCAGLCSVPCNPTEKRKMCAFIIFCFQFCRPLCINLLRSYCLFLPCASRIFITLKEFISLIQQQHKEEAVYSVVFIILSEIHFASMATVRQHHNITTITLKDRHLKCFTSSPTIENLNIPKCNNSQCLCCWWRS